MPLNHDQGTKRADTMSVNYELNLSNLYCTIDSFTI